MKKYIFSFFALLTLTAVQCKKDNPEDQLPPITTTGANTFGCQVNGNVWLPYGSLSVNGLAVSEWFVNYGMSGVLIYANNRKNGALSELDITLKGIKDTGTYQIHNYLNEGFSYSDGTKDYEPFDTFGIVHIIRCDTVQKIISGTFSFVGYTDTSRSIAKSVSITNGRFDLHYPLAIH